MDLNHSIMWMFVFLGLVGRVFIPYMLQRWAGNVNGFDWNYLKSTAAATLLLLLSGAVAAPHLPEKAAWTDIAVGSFWYAYGLGSIAQHIMSAIKAKGQ